MMKPKRTHPLGLLQHIAKSFKDYWFLIILLFTQQDHTSFWFWGIVVLLIWAFILDPFLKWLTLSYAVTPEALVIHSGIFVRHHEHIPYSRIQTVQRKQWFYLKPFHLEEVLIETASHDDNAPEAKLAAVSTTVANQIERYRHTSPEITPEPTDTAESETPVNHPLAHYQINNRDLIKFGLTSLLFVPFLLVLLGLYNKIPQKFSNEVIADASHLALTLLIGGALVIVLLAWLGAFLWTLIRYYHFELTRDPDQLVTAKGLFQRNTITAPLDRVQAVRIKQNILRQWLHLQTVQVLIASKAASNEDNNDLVVMPVIKTPAVYATMHPFISWLPQVHPNLNQLTVPNSWYQMRNAMLIVALPIAACWWLWPSWGWLLLILLPIAAIEGRYAAKNTAGGLVTPDLLGLQTGHFWTRDCYYVPVDKIQSVRLRRSIWMKRTQLAHLTVNVRHGNRNQAIQLRYLPADTAQKIYDWYRHHS